MPSSAVVGQLHEIEFKDRKTYYLFKDSKATLRFVGLPDADLIQAQIVSHKHGAKARLIGKPTKTPEAGGQPYVDFVVEILPQNSGKPLISSIKLHLKAFRKNEDDSYDIVSDITNYIRTKECPQHGSSVCSIVQMKCRQGSTDCVNGYKEVYREFPTECASEKAGATVHSYGTCAY